MDILAETSFLFPLYRDEVHTDKAIATIDQLSSPLPISALVALEFRQAVRFQVFLHHKDKKTGIPKEQGEKTLNLFQADIQEGIIRIMPADWLQVHAIADSLGTKHVPNHGYRILDILHVATALHLGAKQFLTFDQHQSKLAKAEGLQLSLTG